MNTWKNLLLLVFVQTICVNSKKDFEKSAKYYNQMIESIKLFRTSERCQVELHKFSDVTSKFIGILNYKFYIFNAKIILKKVFIIVILQN